MFDRFTERARKVMGLARQEAVRFNHDYIGTEHILLAILRYGEGIGAKVLAGFGIDENRARDTVEEVLKRDMEDTWVFGRLPGSPHYRNVLAHAIDEATQLEAKQIGSEHLLLALLREQGSTAQRVLSKLGVTLKRCRAAVLKQLAQKPT